MRKAAIFIVVALSLILFGTPVYANGGPPALPHAFYGSVEINGSPAPTDTRISATGEGVKTNTIQNPVATTKVGSYGTDSLKLLVQGDILDGATITFYVNGHSTGQTAEWHSGETTELPLSVTIREAAPTPPPPTIETNIFGIEGSFPISSTGIIQQTIEVTSADGKLTITIPKDTKALDKDGKPLSILTSAVEPSPPPPPKDAHIMGLAYDFGPDRATFDPPITLTFSYDPDALPEGVAEEDLVLAYYDEGAGEWVELDCTVDTVNNIITASVPHFTTFAIIGTITPPAPPVPLAPAAFTMMNLSVTPAAVGPGETVTITVLVANTGGEAGSYQVNLVINDLVEATIEVTVRAGLSKEVTFGVTKEEVGSYTVTVNGLSGSFTVVALPVGPPPEPAAFSVSNLTIHPAEVQPKEAVTLTVSVANTGGWVGSYTIVLKINGVKEAEKRVTVAPSDTEAVAFSVTREEAGNYTVAVDGLSGSFTVLLPAAGVNWPVVGGIIAGVIVVGLVIYFLVVRRRTAWLLEKFWKI